MAKLHHIFMAIFSLPLLPRLSQAEQAAGNQAVNLVCDFDSAELGAQTGAPRLKAVTCKHWY